MPKIDLELLDKLYRWKFILEDDLVKLRKEKSNPVPEKEADAICARLDAKIECTNMCIYNIDSSIKLHLRLNNQ